MQTIRVIVETAESTLDGAADICQDFDGRFVVVDDNGESFYVNGWQCDLSFPEFAGFTIDQIIAGFTIPACSEV